MFHRLKNPLRYPDDKSKAINIVLKHVPHNVRRIVSPFFAGGGLEISLVNEGYRVLGSTGYKNLYEFWTCLLDNPIRLSEVGQHFYPIEDENVFYLMQEKINDHDDIFTRAALFFVINRCTEHGTVSTGRLMKGHPKFNEYGLQTLKTFSTNKLRISHSSYSDTINKTNSFILCCAPKYSPMYLLGNVNLAIPEKPKIDHKHLYELLHTKKQWILLTEYHEDLAEIYKKYNLVYLNESFDRTNKQPLNVLITNGV